MEGKNNNCFSRGIKKVILRLILQYCCTVVVCVLCKSARQRKVTDSCKIYCCNYGHGYVLHAVSVAHVSAGRYVFEDRTQDPDSRPRGVAKATDYLYKSKTCPPRNKLGAGNGYLRPTCRETCTPYSSATAVILSTNNRARHAPSNAVVAAVLH